MDPFLYEQFSQIEATHWWFVARREIVLAQIAQHAPRRADRRVLDVGCGTGIMLERLTRFGSAEGLDPSDDAIAYCKQRLGDDAPVQQFALTGAARLPAADVDVITLLDVLEHLDDDAGALRAVAGSLKEGGILVCTVPAYPFLWSGHDVLNEHKRRYTRRRLGDLVRTSGLHIEKLTYFNTLLAPLVFLRRLMQPRSKRMAPRSDFKMRAGWLNGLLRGVFLLEKPVLRLATAPFGISILCVARREGEPA